MKIIVEDCPATDYHEKHATLEIVLGGGAALGDYDEFAEEFIGVVNREEAIELILNLINVFHIDSDHMHTLHFPPGTDKVEMLRKVADRQEAVRDRGAVWES